VIAAVGVVVPARNEQDRIVGCLRSLRRALARLPTETAAAVTVVLDRCTDRTSDRVATMIADWPQAEAVLAPNTLPRAGRAAVGSGVGALRALGLRRALARLGAHPTDRTWLLSTDADTTVPPDWACAHLRLASAGAHGVAGLAELAGGARLSPDVLHRYRALVASGLHGRHHEHVYGANLGFRADAYLAVGGFPIDGPGEDHGLWRLLTAAGYRLEHPTTVAVQTSARVRGRVEGGLADLLRSLHGRDRDGRNPAAGVAGA
jgi:glycosyltransferase involved in cell wall biosynthesis